MKVIFLSGGARELALRHLLNNGIDIISVITPVPSSKNSRFLNVIIAAHEYNIPVITVTKQTVNEKVQQIDFDVLLSCGFSYILSQDTVAKAKKIAINVHPTLLPKYRGYRSGPFIIINGETKSGVTVHRLTEGMDRGEIISQIEFPLGPFDTTKSLFRKAKEIEPELILQTLRSIESNNFNLKPQNERDATEYNQLRTPKDSVIDWNKPLKDLFNEIRACDPVDYPAHFYVNGEKVNVKLWRDVKPTGEDDLI